MRRELLRLLAPLARRIRLTAARSVVSLINDALKLQGVQVKLLADEVRDQVERFQNYGLTSVPHAGAEGIYLSLNGSRDHGVVICVDDRRYRLTGLADGEVALYDDIGQRVHLKRNGIAIDSPQNIILRTDGVLRLDGDHVEIHGRTSVQTDIHGKGSRETWTGGTHWHTDGYTDAHTADSTEQGLSMPAVPSDHPEGP